MKKTIKPLVSVIMPVYNAEDYLSEAIESILRQTYKNFELIIINDASKDGSLEIIAKYKKLYPKIIRVIKLKRNLNRGGDACANKGITIAKGKYIARMDADDIALPKRLEKQVDYLEKNPAVFLLGTNAYVIDKEGKIIGEKNVPENLPEIRKAYFTFHPMIHPSCMFRNNCGSRKFDYTIKYSTNNDYYTFFKLLCQGYRFANLKEKLIYYRIHGKNMTFKAIKNNLINTLKIRKQMFLKHHYDPSITQIAVNLMQMVSLLLPENILAYLYLVAKGIIKPQMQLKGLASSMKKGAQLRMVNLLR